MKRLALISGIVLLVVAIIAAGYFLLTRQAKTVPPVADDQNPPTTKKQVITDVALADRPFLSLIPRADGRELTITVANLKNADKVEYELVYLSNDLSRGALGTMTVAANNTASHKVLLGSCSKNTCKYDDNVSVGTLTLRVESTDGIRKFTTSFHLQKGASALTSVDLTMQPDAKFKYEASLPKTSYFITMETLGLPEALAGQPSSPAYGVFASAPVTLKQAKVTLAGEGTLYQYDQTWKELATNQTTSLGIFVTVSD